MLASLSQSRIRSTRSAVTRRKRWSAPAVGLDVRRDLLTFYQQGAAIGSQRQVRIPFAGGDLLSADCTREAIFDTLEPYKPELKQFPGRRVHCVLPNSCVNMSSFTLPRAERSELRAMVEQELADVSQTDVDDLTFDITCFDIPEDEDSLLVDVTSTSRQLVESFVKGLRQCGLDCELVQPRAAAASRYARPDETDQNGPTAVLDWEAAEVTLTIYDNGRRAYFRALRDCQLELLDKELSAKWELTRHQTHGMFRYLQEAADTLPVALKSFHESWQQSWNELQLRLLTEVERTLEFARFQRGIAPAGRVVLIGEAVGMFDVQPFAGELREIIAGHHRNKEAVTMTVGGDLLLAQCASGRSKHVS